jgi:hypothetical protein
VVNVPHQSHLSEMTRRKGRKGRRVDSDEEETEDHSSNDSQRPPRNAPSHEAVSSQVRSELRAKFGSHAGEQVRSSPQLSDVPATHSMVSGARGNIANRVHSRVFWPSAKDQCAFVLAVRSGKLITVCMRSSHLPVDSCCAAHVQPASANCRAGDGRPHCARTQVRHLRLFICGLHRNLAVLQNRRQPTFRGPCGA